MNPDSIKKTTRVPRYRKLIPILYFCALFTMVGIALLNIAMKDRPGVAYGLRSFHDMNTGWMTSQGEEFVISQIDYLRMADSDTVSVFHSLPKAIQNEESIVFRSKNCSVAVLVDGTLVYQTDIVNAPFYNHSPGTRWNIVAVHADDAGKTVELQVKQAYQDGRAKVDNFYFGDRAAIVLHLIQSKLWSCIISLLIFFVAIGFLAAWVVLNWRQTQRDNSLLWLAIFAIAASCWSLLETNLLQLFSQNLRLIQVVDNMMLVLASLPLYLYLDSIFGVFRSRVVRVLCALSLGYILFATLSQILRLWDFHQTLNGAIASYGVVVILFFISMIRQDRKIKAFSTPNERLIYILRQAGMLALGLGLLADLTRYLLSDVLDRAFCIRIGLLFFIVFFGASNIIKMIQLVKRGLEADIVGQLAYVDGLTKAGNRTAYIEQLQWLETKHPNEPITLVMFDINNLKYVNDTWGHKEGDRLILCCARLLQTAFSSGWRIYRIGGDEFVALRYGGDVRTAYEAAEKAFLAEICLENENQEKLYAVAIAHGVAFAEVITRQTVEFLEQEADRNMYQDKYRLKCIEK